MKQEVSWVIECLLLLIFICVAFSNSAPTKADEMYLYLAVDAAQTNSLSKDPAFEETNPLLGKSPSAEKIAIHFLSSAVGYTLGKTWFHGIHKTRFMYVMRHIEAGFIVGNCLSGVMCPTNSQQMPGDTITIKFNTKW